MDNWDKARYTSTEPRSAPKEARAYRTTAAMMWDFVFQFYNLFAQNLTAHRNVELAARICK